MTDDLILRSQLSFGFDFIVVLSTITCPARKADGAPPDLLQRLMGVVEPGKALKVCGLHKAGGLKAETRQVPGSTATKS